MLRTRFCCVFAAVMVWPMSLARGGVLTLNGTQFFLDDALIERMDGLRREFHPAAKRGVVKDNEKPWETGSGGNGVQVFKDGDRWHMYYGSIQWDVADDAKGDVAQHYRCLVCYATSSDGLKWSYPTIGKLTTPVSSTGGWNGRMRPVGSTHENNALLEGQLTSTCEDRERLSGKKLLLHAIGPGLMGSDDWVHFEPTGKAPPRHTVFGFIYNADDKVWEAFTQGVLGPEFPRKIGRHFSPDLKTWNSHLSLQPDEKDSQKPDRYDEIMAMSARRESGLTIGFVTVFHGDRTDPRYAAPGGYAWRKGTTEVQLACTRDGKSWTRLGDRQPWLAHGPQEHSYDRLAMLANGGIRNGDELWFYYEGWDGDHLTYDSNGKPFYPGGRMREGRVALATIRLDGYVSLRPKDEAGTITTKPFKLEGDALYVNANAKRGELRVEVLDEHERLIEGLSAENCLPITNDGVHQAVSWNDGPSLKALAAKVIRLRFALQRCDLYTFSLESDMTESKPAAQ